MKLVPRSENYRRAEREAEAARSLFLGRLYEARYRLAPAMLKKDAARQIRQAAEHAKHQAAATARQHPFITGGILTGVIGLLLRRPILALSKAAGASLRKAWRARQEKEASDE